MSRLRGVGLAMAVFSAQNRRKHGSDQTQPLRFEAEYYGTDCIFW